MEWGILAVVGFFALVYLFHAILVLVVWDYLFGDDED